MSLTAPSQLRTKTPVRFLGVGAAVPDEVVTNADLEARLDTTDEWIRERTGIRERHRAGPGDTTASLAVSAGRAALQAAGVEASSIGLVVLATTTPDQQTPATAATVQRELGTSGAAFDLNAVCAGFAYALPVAVGTMAATGIGRTLVIGADRITSLVDPSDRNTSILFGDGAGALVLAAADEPDDPTGPGLLSVRLDGDGHGVGFLEVPPGERYMHMDGYEVYRRATRGVVASCRAVLDEAGATADDIDLFVPHQANARIIEAVTSRLGLAPERVVINLDRYGNTSGGSVPIALTEAAADGRIPDGGLVLISGVGAGMAWASTLLRWGS